MVKEFRVNTPIPIGNLLENDFQSIPCWEFKLLSDASQIRYFPWTTVSPAYPYAYFSSDYYSFEILDNIDYERSYNAVKYASSNGGAVGIGITEALVHAINELIERDAHSMFLIECFHRNNLDNYFLIEHTTIGYTLYSLLKFIEDKFSEDVIIIDVTSELSIPTFLCHTTNRSHPDSNHFTGVGTALSRYYALERALLELLQALNSSHSLDGLKDRTDNDLNFEELCRNSLIPFYRNAYSYSPKIFAKNKQKSFEDVVSYSLSLNEQMDFFNELLIKFNIKLYYKSINIFKDIYKVKCVAPDLEEICLDGHLRLPSSRRGQKLWGIG